MKLFHSIWKTTAWPWLQAGGGADRVEAAVVGPALAVVHQPWCGHLSHSSYDQLSSDNDLHLVWGAGDRSPAHRRCRQEQTLCMLRCSNCWETKVTGNSLRCWSAKQVWSKQRMRKWWTECCEACTSMTWKSSGKRMSWKAGNQNHEQSTIPDRNGVSAGEPEDAWVLLWLLG